MRLCVFASLPNTELFKPMCGFTPYSHFCFFGGASVALSAAGRSAAHFASVPYGSIRLVFYTGIFLPLISAQVKVSESLFSVAVLQCCDFNFFSSFEKV